MRSSRRRVIVVLVFGVSACALTKSGFEQAVDQATTAVRTKAENVRSQVEDQWRRQGERDAATLAPFVERMSPTYVWLTEHRSSDRGVQLDVAVHESATAGGGLNSIESVVVRLCVRLDVGQGAPVVMTDAPCPSTLDDHVRELGSVKATVSLE